MNVYQNKFKHKDVDIRLRRCRGQVGLLVIMWGAHLGANTQPIDPMLVATLSSPCAQYSIVNSIAFHPKKNLFCVTYTHGNKVVLYSIDEEGNSKIFQSLNNPSAQLSEPASAAFSPDGENIVVANWTNQTINIYRSENNGMFCQSPAVIIPNLRRMNRYKAHGLVFSPCGNFLAIAYGASSRYGRAVGMFRWGETELGCELIDLLEELPGIPKGITFTPDGDCLLVTFSDVNSLAIFDFNRADQRIRLTPRQVIQGDETKISRPEDVKISSDGRWCALSNSDKHTVTFYPFNSAANLITCSTPSYILENSNGHLCFPHGIAFSPEGRFVLITAFGPIGVTQEGDISWSRGMKPDHAKVHIYKLL